MKEILFWKIIRRNKNTWKSRNLCNQLVRCKVSACKSVRIQDLCFKQITHELNEKKKNPPTCCVNCTHVINRCFAKRFDAMYKICHLFIWFYLRSKITAIWFSNKWFYVCQKSLELTSIYLKPILTLLAFIYLPLKNEKNAFLCIENKLRTEKEKT